MSFLMRTVTKVPRAQFSRVLAASPRRYAHSSYGNEQSGHEQGTHEKNPKVDLEHPGPKAPAEKDGSSSGSPSDGASGSKPSSGGSGSQASNGAKPKIHEEHSPKEDSDPEVRKHNEEMKQRADRSPNQLEGEDKKVDKHFWQGDVGDMDQKK